MSRFALGIAGVLVFCGFALAGPAEMFEEKEKDFGVSPKGTVLVHYFRFTNNTKTTVTYDVTATLDKDCPAGNWMSDVYLETSNAAVAKLRIPVTVNVAVPVAAKPEQVSFGDVKMGSASEQTVTIQSATPFKILSVK